jgi:hypothetical protein
MSPVTGLVVGLVGTLVTYLGAWRYPQRLGAGVATNHRGRRVPLSLGFALMACYVIVLLLGVELVFASDPERRAKGLEALWLLVALVAVFSAGLYDDRQPGRVHGLRAHFAELARGQVTSGIVKLLVGVAAATIGALALGARGWVLAVGIPLVAGTTNLWNLLDVAPGRALKFGFLLSVLLATLGGSGLAWATVGSTALLLPLDVRERGMLGDAGANVLGFVLGILLLSRMSSWGLAVALVAVLALHAIAETVTLTRVIRAVPPLRWLDDLWRIPAEESRVE